MYFGEVSSIQDTKMKHANLVTSITDCKMCCITTRLAKSSDEFGREANVAHILWRNEGVRWVVTMYTSNKAIEAEIKVTALLAGDAFVAKEVWVSS